MELALKLLFSRRYDVVVDAAHDIRLQKQWLNISCFGFPLSTANGRLSDSELNAETCFFGFKLIAHAGIRIRTPDLPPSKGKDLNNTNP